MYRIHPKPDALRTSVSKGGSVMGNQRRRKIRKAIAEGAALALVTKRLA